MRTSRLLIHLSRGIIEEQWVDSNVVTGSWRVQLSSHVDCYTRSKNCVYIEIINREYSISFFSFGFVLSVCSTWSSFWSGTFVFQVQYDYIRNLESIHFVIFWIGFNVLFILPCIHNDMFYHRRVAMNIHLEYIWARGWLFNKFFSEIFWFVGRFLFRFNSTHFATYKKNEFLKKCKYALISKYFILI